jgi:hypothetical protein
VHLTKIDVSGARLNTLPATIVTCQGLGGAVQPLNAADPWRLKPPGLNP